MILPQSCLNFRTIWIHGYNDRLLTHSPDQLEYYRMLEIFSDVHDAVQELKYFQIDNEDGNTLLGIGWALGATLKCVTQGDSSIIKAIGGAIHDTLNGVDDLDEKVVGNLGEVAPKLIELAGHAVKGSIKHVPWYLWWDGRNNPMVHHFVDNIGFRLCQPFYTPKTLSKQSFKICISNHHTIN